MPPLSVCCRSLPSKPLHLVQLGGWGHELLQGEGGARNHSDSTFILFSMPASVHGVVAAVLAQHDPLAARSPRLLLMLCAAPRCNYQLRIVSPCPHGQVRRLPGLPRFLLLRRDELCDVPECRAQLGAGPIIQKGHRHAACERPSVQQSPSAFTASESNAGQPDDIRRPACRLLGSAVLPWLCPLSSRCQIVTASLVGLWFCAALRSRVRNPLHVFAFQYYFNIWRPLSGIEPVLREILAVLPQQGRV